MKSIDIKTYTDVKLLSTVAQLKTLDGVKYSMPKVSYFHLKEAKNRTEQKLDGLFIITGPVGSGKSNKGKLLSGTWQEHFNNHAYILDYCHFNADKFIERCDMEDNHTEAINFDEAIQGGGSKDGGSKIGKLLRTRLITKRTKRHLYIVTVDSLKELNDKIIERCVAWYHVYYIRDKDGIYQKGYFKTFSPRQALIVYEDLKDKKVRDTKQHYIFQTNKFKSRDMDASNLWYSEAEYDKKKLKETSFMESDSNDKFKTHRNKMIVYCKDTLKAKFVEIADTLDLDPSSVREAYRKQLKANNKEYQ